jgi:carboxypeptidase C (cathepsin A)
MKPIFCFRLVLLLALGTFTMNPLAAQTPADDKKGEKTDEKKGSDKKESSAEKAPPKKEEKPKESKGAVTVGGAEIRYLAQTGTMPVLKEDGTPRADVFYVYYAAVDAEGKRLSQSDSAARPITYCFNGGPGASAVWLHLGGLGPRRIEWPAEGLTMTTVGRIIGNPNTILDVTDLVFIDPVSTGLSRAAKGEKAEQFFGVDEDIESVGEFIRLFTTREQRWSSPKFLCGESYGVLRAAGVVDYLQDTHAMYFDGLMLVSGLLNWQTLSADPGNDLPYITALPSLTATAHYHRKLPPDLQADFDKAVSASRAFAFGEYATALLRGRTLSPDERRRIAERLAQLTGLTPQQVDEQELRIRPEFFREMLLRDQGKILGRFDARVTSEDANRGRLAPDFDPSLSNVIGAFSSSVNAYIRGELGYESDHPYRVLTGLPWRYTSFANKYVAMEPRLGEAMKQNPKLRVLVLVGRRDLAVPPDAMRYSINHLPIPDSLRPNVRFIEYDSGHMMYLYAKDAERLRNDLAGFVRHSENRTP